MTNGHINPANVPDIALKDGHSIPQVGLGVLRVDDEGVVPVVESALEAGYRHIDGAAGYDNEAGVGRALAASGYNKGAKRETLWVTTKLRDSEQGYDSALKAFDNSLKLLQLDYVDMYMIHWPTPFDWRSTDTWKAFVKLRDEGLARTLGVCNFMPADLKRLHEETGAWPAVNQIELHPTWQQREVVACSSAVSSKPNRSRFSFWRAACTDFGMMMVPFSMCQRRITRAGLTPCAAAIFSIVPLPALRSAPRAIGE